MKSAVSWNEITSSSSPEAFWLESLMLRGIPGGIIAFRGVAENTPPVVLREHP